MILCVFVCRNFCFVFAFGLSIDELNKYKINKHKKNHTQTHNADQA